ncbi:DUF397 domain-containing protein [Streptomyces sp. NPDC088747]|uniref:DUF397 domain-containing protein n=1 Tax=Streptomyces sp. NPDC088747 TaxID=3365886 RepID=UPI003819314A
MSDRLKWFKSSRSDDEGGNCVEVALTPLTTYIRDTKLPTSPELHIASPAWTAFIATVQPGA